MVTPFLLTFAMRHTSNLAPTSGSRLFKLGQKPTNLPMWSDNVGFRVVRVGDRIWRAPLCEEYLFLVFFCLKVLKNCHGLTFFANFCPVLKVEVHVPGALQIKMI